MSSRIILMLPLLAIGCSETTAPPEAPPRQAAAQVDRGTAVFQQDFTGPIDCAGEDIRFVFQVPYTWQQVTTPTGSQFKIHFEDQGATGTATGQTSGTIWTLDQIALTEIDNQTGELFIHYHGMGVWRSADGPTIQNHELWKFRLDTDGNVVLDDFTLRFTCRAA